MEVGQRDNRLGWHSVLRRRRVENPSGVGHAARTARHDERDGSGSFRHLFLVSVPGFRRHLNSHVDALSRD